MIDRPIIDQADDSELQRLVEAHPLLFRGTPPSIPSYLSPGWFTLADQLCSDIERLLGPACAQFEVLEVKEKFAGLQFGFRMKGCSDEVWERALDLASRAQAASESMCKKCGAPARLHSFDGWLVALCETHATKRERARQAEALQAMADDARRLGLEY